MIQRLHRFRWPDRRRRFRDRLLAGMLAVSIVPLVLFAALVAADLGSVSRSTVDEANRGILQDQAQVHQGQVSLAVTSLETRLRAAETTLQGLRLRAAAVLSQAAAADPSPLTEFAGLHYLNGLDSTVIASGGPSFQPQRVQLDAGQTVGLLDAMRAALTDQDIGHAWIADTEDGVVRVHPGVDVAARVARHAMDPEASLARAGAAPFSATEVTPGAAAVQSSWSEPSGPGASRDVGATWTDPYPTDRPGVEDVTVWMPVPVGDGHRYQVGLDLAVNQIAGVVPGSVTGDPGAYPLLVSGVNQVLAGDIDNARKEFPGLPRSAWIGTHLPLGGDPSFRDGLLGVEQNGHATVLAAHLGGVDKQVYTAAVQPVRWVLAVAVPTRDLLPSQAGLSRGIETGVRRILVQVIPIALALCALGFVLATFLARRLVGPVGALTAAAERLADGHTDEAVPPQGEDEVGLLAASLERMRREVNSSRDAILAAARELEHRVADRTAELRARNEELVALNALAGSLTNSLDPAVLLGDALDALRAFLPLLAGHGYHLEEGRLRLLASHPGGGTPDTDVGRGLAAIGADALESRDLAIRPQSSAVLVGLPLETGDGPLGAMAVAAVPGWQLSARTRALLGAVADQVGLALRTAQLSAEGRELAVLEERTRLAREIHDTLAQQLTAIVLQLEAAEAFVGRNHERAHNVVVAARDLARSALQEARRSVWDLRPAPLDATGLAAAVQLEVSRWSSRTGIAANVRTHALPVPLALDPHAEVALFRILQEALSNCARHSRAGHVDVRLEHCDGVLELRVEDDGSGFDAHGSRRPGSFGLVSMTERARLIGATLSVDGAAGRGTSVVVRLPPAEAATVGATA